MAKIKKLPSGSHNSVVYAEQDANGKRQYKSFTAKPIQETVTPT